MGEAHSFWELGRIPKKFFITILCDFLERNWRCEKNHTASPLLDLLLLVLIIIGCLVAFQQLVQVKETSDTSDNRNGVDDKQPVCSSKDVEQHPWNLCDHVHPETNCLLTALSRCALTSNTQVVGYTTQKTQNQRDIRNQLTSVHVDFLMFKGFRGLPAVPGSSPADNKQSTGYPRLVQLLIV